MTEEKTQRNELAERLVFAALDKDPGLWSDPNFLVGRAYRIADAMMEARKQ